MARISTLLDQIDAGTLLLPEFQRGYVWSRDQVRSLMRSLYLGYPIGSLLLWETNATNVETRGTTADGMRLLLLDGQQRLTTLYGIIRNRPPMFFDDDPAKISGLHFNVMTEEFQYYSRVSMRSDGRWVDLGSLFSDGPGQFLERLSQHDGRAAQYVNRLNKILLIAERDIGSEIVTGRSTDVVVDIFNEVNSGGRKLSKGDLAMARACARLPDGRRRVRDHLQRWRDAGFNLSAPWFLRGVTAVATGRSDLDTLNAIGNEHFERALASTPEYIDRFLGVLNARLGVDHDEVLMGRSQFPVVCRLFHLYGNEFTDLATCDRLLYWHLAAALRRYTSSTATMLGRDLGIAGREGLDGLIAELERSMAGEVLLGPRDFDTAGKHTQAYPLLYAMSRRANSRDLVTGQVRVNGTKLEPHPIFPRHRLREMGFPPSYVNAIANLCFVERTTAASLKGAEPEDYLGKAESQSTGTLGSHWIPTDETLWSPSKYPEFLEARRGLLASAAQQVLDALGSAGRP